MLFDSLFQPHHDPAGHDDDASPDHFHLTHDSNTPDSDGDGFSDAMEHLFGTDPFNTGDHPHINGLDSDGDGFSDVREHLADTDPFSAISHPSLVMAHHAHIAPDVKVNFAGRFDVPTGDVSPAPDDSSLSLFDLLYQDLK